MSIPPYSPPPISILPHKQHKEDFLNVFDGLPARYIKMKSSENLRVMFLVGDTWVDFPDDLPANVWVDIEEDITSLLLENLSSSTATVRLYATTYGSTKQGPVYRTEVVPNTIGVE